MPLEAFSDRKMRPLDYSDALDYGSKRRKDPQLLSSLGFNKKPEKPQTSINITNIDLPNIFAGLAGKLAL